MTTSRLAHADDRPKAPSRRNAFAQVEIYENAQDALDAWAIIEASAPHSAYQRRDWILPWLDTIGRARGVAPAIAVARDEANRVVALLPLGVERRGPLRLGEFLGGKDANFTFGLFRPDAPFDLAETRRLLQEAGRKARLDLLALVNQPHEWEGARNPIAALPHQASPSDGHKARIESDGEAYLRRRLSKDTRKKLRRKDERLAALGELRHVVAQDAATAQSILSAFHAQKAPRLKAKGVDNAFESEAARDFLDRVAVAPLARGDKPSVELHALFCGERIVATFGGAATGPRFSGMFNSFDEGPEIARCSPGDILLTKIIASKAAEGCVTFDLGVGEARYKTMFCNQREQLFDAYVAITAAGRLLQAVKSTKRHVKRAIKQSHTLWTFVERIRRLRA